MNLEDMFNTNPNPNDKTVKKTPKFAKEHIIPGAQVPAEFTDELNFELNFAEDRENMLKGMRVELTEFFTSKIWHDYQLNKNFPALRAELKAKIEERLATIEDHIGQEQGVQTLLTTIRKSL